MLDSSYALATNLVYSSFSPTSMKNSPQRNWEVVPRTTALSKGLYCMGFLVLVENEIKATMRCHHTSAEVAKICNTGNTQCWGCNREEPVLTPRWICSFNFVHVFSHIRLFVTLWTEACQASVMDLSMGFSRQWIGVGCHFFLQGNLRDPGVNPMSPAFTGGYFTTEPSEN